MKLFNFKYGPELERTISIDLDRIIFISDTLVKNITDHFEFPSKEYRDSDHFNILRASYSSVILPTRE